MGRGGGGSLDVCLNLFLCYCVCVSVFGVFNGLSCIYLLVPEAVSRPGLVCFWFGFCLGLGFFYSIVLLGFCCCCSAIIVDFFSCIFLSLSASPHSHICIDVFVCEDICIRVSVRISTFSK